MKFVGHQAAIGALIAVALVLGASASADGIAVNTQSAMIYGNQQSETRESMAVLRDGFAADFQTCSGKVLSAGLDLAGEIAARMKQM
jgi:hypothetical protein